MGRATIFAKALGGKFQMYGFVNALGVLTDGRRLANQISLSFKERQQTRVCRLWHTHAEPTRGLEDLEVHAGSTKDSTNPAV